MSSESETPAVEETASDPSGQTPVTPDEILTEPPVEEVSADKVSADEAPADEASAEAAEPVTPDPAALLQDAEDRYLRLCAEFENYKKRTARENDDFKKYANESLLKELLPVLDNFERAMAHTAEEGAEAGGDKIMEGVSLIHKQFTDALEKFGVTPVDALNKVFDPSMHQAVSQVETDDVAEGHVAQEFRKGFYYKERVLRPAMVVVAKSVNKDSAS